MEWYMDTLGGLREPQRRPGLEINVAYDANRGGDVALTWLRERLSDPPPGIIIKIRPVRATRRR